MPGVWVFPGGSVDAADGAGEAGFRACAVRELAEEAGIELAAEEELVLFSRWITPEAISTRFDAHFFLALAPAHTPPASRRRRDHRRRPGSSRRRALEARGSAASSSSPSRRSTSCAG